MLSYFERRANLHCYIQAVHALLYIVAMCYFYSVVTIKYLQKCEGCTLSFPTFFKYHVLCSEERNAYRIGTTWGWANDDRIFIFGWTAPLIICFQTMCLILLLNILEQRSLSLPVSIRACSKGTMEKECRFTSTQCISVIIIIGILQHIHTFMLFHATKIPLHHPAISRAINLRGFDV